jgi:hypothetical protein
MTRVVLSEGDMRTHTTGQDRGRAVRPGKVYRGSRRKVRRITLRGNWSIELLLFVAWLLFCLLVLVPWMVRHPPQDRVPQPAESESIKPSAVSTRPR